jgi:hypothetical protein
MTPDAVWHVARARLEALTGERVIEPAFVDDGVVDYETPERIYVRRESLFELEASQDWVPFLGEADEPPSWLHLNLLGSTDGVSVVAVRRSGSVSRTGAPMISVSAKARPLTIEDV